MASIQRIVSPITGKVSYRAQVRVKGRRPQGETFPNKREAADWATSTEAAIREARRHPRQKAARTPFAEIAVRYSKAVLGGLKGSGQKVRQQHLNWWIARFAGLTLAEITADVVAQARDDLASSTYTRGKPRKDRDGNNNPPKHYARSGATTNRYLATLSHLFTIVSKEWQLTDGNPARDISKKKESRGRVRFLSDEERQRLLSACDTSRWQPLRTLVLLAISTGARRRELINLKWSDIDLKAARATVRATKNGDPRILPLVGRALEALREMRLNGGGRSEYVFAQPSGFLGPYDHFDPHWYDALETAGITDLRFHDLRHTTASYLAQQGASLLEIADTLGHRTLQMVKRYAHLTQTHKVAALERMAREKGL
jgi:integrase